MRLLAATAAALAAAVLLTLPAAAAEEGVIQEIRRTEGHTVIIYKDYNPRPRARKPRPVPDFKAYDVTPAVPVVPAAKSQPAAPAPAPPAAPAQPVRSYTQTHEGSLTASTGGGMAPATTTYVTSPGFFGGVAVGGTGLVPFAPLGPVVINRHTFPFQRVDPFAVAGFPYGRPVPFTTPVTIPVPTVQTRVVNGQIQVTVP